MMPSAPLRSPLGASLRPLALALLVAASCAPAGGRCLDEDRFDAGNPGALSEPPPSTDPRATLQNLVRESLARSNAVGAARLLAEAALSDIDETRAAGAIQAGLSGALGPGGARSLGITETSAAQARLSLNASQLLWDGGRNAHLVAWRTLLADSAKNGHLSQSEQLAATTVALALERYRLRTQVGVYTQYVRKTGCLVEALEIIVRADRGRASELVQARKSRQQAELALTQTQSLVRQIEVRLRRLAGDDLPPAGGLATQFTEVPNLDRMVAEVEQAYEIAQLTAQAGAAERFARAAEASGRPQLSWTATGSAAATAGGSIGNTRSGTYSLGLVLNIPLLDPGVQPATDAARKRALAAGMQRAEALEARRFRVAEVHEQANAAQDRARRLAGVLRDSDTLRNATLQQWQQLGRRSLFDVMASEAEHVSLRLAYVNALVDLQQLNANLLSLGRGVNEWLK
jgi:outer membrane protein TolC